MLDVMNALKNLRCNIQLAHLRVKATAAKIHDINSCSEFTCNICGRDCLVPSSLMRGRESRSCYYCGSTLRFRSIINALSVALFSDSIALPDFPLSKHISGIGLSDSRNYASRLENIFSYDNTFYHKNPKLNLMSIPKSRFSSTDFVISSDVLEHVPPPVDIAFTNLFRLLKPSGFCVLTVPMDKSSGMQEHFPDLHDFTVKRRRGMKILENTTRDGQTQVFTNIRFHGGGGSTLEMRVFSELSVLKYLDRAGFQSIHVCKESYPKFGICWMEDAATPVIAWK